MTLEKSLRRDLELVTRALGLVERIPAHPTEPLRNPLRSEWPNLGPEAQHWQDFLMGTPQAESGSGTGAREQMSPILSSFRIDLGRIDLDLIHAGLFNVAGWDNTPGHENTRRRLILLLEDVADYLRTRLKRECGAESVTRRGQRGNRRLRTISRREDLDPFQVKAMQLLAQQSGTEPIKGSAIAATCGVAPGTSKRGLGELVKCGCLNSSRRGYVFVRWPGATAPGLEP